MLSKVGDSLPHLMPSHRGNTSQTKALKYSFPKRGGIYNIYFTEINQIQRNIVSTQPWWQQLQLFNISYSVFYNY